MMDPITEFPIFQPQEIKKDSLDYCLDLLNTRISYKDHEDYYYIHDMIHIVHFEDESEGQRF